MWPFDVQCSGLPLPVFTLQVKSNRPASKHACRLSCCVCVYQVWFFLFPSGRSSLQADERTIMSNCCRRIHLGHFWSTKVINSFAIAIDTTTKWTPITDFVTHNWRWSTRRQVGVVCYDVSMSSVVSHHTTDVLMKIEQYMNSPKYVCVNDELCSRQFFHWWTNCVVMMPNIPKQQQTIYCYDYIIQRNRMPLRVMCSACVRN